MNILAVDQARSGAWAIFDDQTKEIVAYDCWNFPSNSFTYAEVMVNICDIVEDLVKKYQVSAVFIEDIQLRQSADSFKKLAQLQGALVSTFERNNYLYDYVPPSRWQAFCKARGRSSKEIKKKVTSLEEVSGKKQSKVLSIEFIKEQFGIDTENDNIADAICMGYYIACNIRIGVVDEEE